MAVSSNRRQSQRIQPFVAPCRYVVEEARGSGFMTDISRDGGRVTTESPPPSEGAAVVVELRVPRQAVALRLSATVRWARPADRGGHVFGVSFERLGEEERKALDDLVDGFLRRAASIV